LLLFRQKFKEDLESSPLAKLIFKNFLGGRAGEWWCLEYALFCRSLFQLQIWTWNSTKYWLRTNAV